MKFQLCNPSSVFEERPEFQNGCVASPPLIYAHMPCNWLGISYLPSSALLYQTAEWGALLIFASQISFAAKQNIYIGLFYEIHFSPTDSSLRWLLAAHRDSRDDASWGLRSCSYRQCIAHIPVSTLHTISHITDHLSEAHRDTCCPQPPSVIVYNTAIPPS